MDSQHIESNIQGEDVPSWEQVPVETVGAIESFSIGHDDSSDGEIIEDGFDGA